MMKLYLLLHRVVMHATAALVILLYILLFLPVRLLSMRAFVRPLRKEDLRGKVVLIAGASSGIGEVSNISPWWCKHLVVMLAEISS